MRIEWITERAYQMAISRIFNKNMRIYGNSLSKASISNKLSSKGVVLEIRDKDLLMSANWRSELKTMLTHTIEA